MLSQTRQIHTIPRSPDGDNKYFVEKEEDDGSAQDEMKLLAIKLNSSSQREG